MEFLLEFDFDKNRNVFYVLGDEVQLRVEFVQGRHVFIVDFALRRLKKSKKEVWYFNEHFHHVRVNGDLVDESTYHAIHCSAIFQLLRND